MVINNINNLYMHLDYRLVNKLVISVFGFLISTLTTERIQQIVGKWGKFIIY